MGTENLLQMLTHLFAKVAPTLAKSFANIAMAKTVDKNTPKTRSDCPRTAPVLPPFFEAVLHTDETSKRMNPDERPCQKPHGCA